MRSPAKLAFIRPISLVALAAVASCATSNTGLATVHSRHDVTGSAETRVNSPDINAIAAANFARLGLPPSCFHQLTGSDENWRYVYFLLPSDETAVRNCEAAVGRRLYGVKYTFSAEGELVRRTGLR